MIIIAAIKADLYTQHNQYRDDFTLIECMYNSSYVLRTMNNPMEVRKRDCIDLAGKFAARSCALN